MTRYLPTSSVSWFHWRWFCLILLDVLLMLLIVNATDMLNVYLHLYFCTLWIEFSFESKIQNSLCAEVSYWCSNRLWFLLQLVSGQTKLRWQELMVWPISKQDVQALFCSVNCLRSATVIDWKTLHSHIGCSHLWIQQSLMLVVVSLLGLRRLADVYSIRCFHSCRKGTRRTYLSLLEREITVYK